MLFENVNYSDGLRSPSSFKLSLPLMNSNSKTVLPFIKWPVHLGGPSAPGRRSFMLCVTSGVNEDGMAKRELA